MAFSQNQNKNGLQMGFPPWPALELGVGKWEYSDPYSLWNPLGGS